MVWLIPLQHRLGEQYYHVVASVEALDPLVVISRHPMFVPCLTYLISLVIAAAALPSGAPA